MKNAGTTRRSRMVPPHFLLLFLFLHGAVASSSEEQQQQRQQEKGPVPTTTSTTSEWKVGYQVHSCNSLAEWSSLVRKGARSFKIDPRWIEADGGMRCKDPAGCMVLSHDPPLLRLHHVPGYYSMLEDVLQVLTNVPAVHSVAQQEHLRIALCFKGAPHDLCEDDFSFWEQHHYSHQARWLRKVDAFFDQASHVIATQGLQVEFVLDGDGLPLDCLAQRWRPWRSVWMNGSAPAEAFASDVAREGLDRFQILNEPADFGRWRQLADPAVDYGKFSAGEYPYQLWEPGNQKAIQTFVEIFKSGRPHPPGLNFATNADAAMFQVYSGVGLNQDLRPAAQVEEKKEEAGDGGGLITVLQPGLALVLPDRYQAGFRTYAFDATQPLSFDKGLAELSSSPSSLLHVQLSLEEEAARIQTFVASDDGVLLVSTTEGNYFLYDLVPSILEEKGSAGVSAILRDTGSFRAAPVSSQEVATSSLRRQSRSLAAKEEDRLSFSSSLLSVGNTSATLLELYIDHAQHTKGCRLAYQVRRKGGKKMEEEDLVLADECLWWRESNDEKMEEEEGKGTWDVQSAVTVPVRQQDGKVEVVLVFASVGAKVHLSEIPQSSSWSSTSSSSPSFVGGGESGQCVVQIGVGHSVAASARAPANGQGPPIVMLVTGGGFCYNSHLHNTGPFNVCQLTPHATSGVLDYTYGTVEQWIDLLHDTCSNSSEQKQQQRLINSCDPVFFHGSYDLGRYPSVTLFPVLSPAAGGVGMLELHSGFTRTCPEEPLARPGMADAEELRSKLKACECGPALTRPLNSLVVDSFPLQSPPSHV